MNRKVGLWFVESWEYDCVSVSLSVCCSPGCLGKTKGCEENKANSIQRVHLHALLFSLLPFFSVSAVTNLALSSRKLQVVRIVVMAHGVLLFHSISLISQLMAAV